MVSSSVTKASSRTVVVTGVSSGIGEAIALHLLQAGYNVFGSVRKASDARRLQQSLGDKFVPMEFDVRDRDAVNRSAATVHNSLNGQPLTALINNAGLAAFGPMECLDDDHFDDIVAVNLLGTRIVTNAFIPSLRQQTRASATDASNTAGKIINISSLSGILNTPMNGAYCVSKHAMESLNEIYRRELLSSGIGVFSIRSGPIQSKIWEKNKSVPPSYENADYQIMSQNAQAIMDDAASKALPASVIAELVQAIIENKKRKLAYELGRGAVMAKLLSSWIPTRIADQLINRALLKTK